MLEFRILGPLEVLADGEPVAAAEEAARAARAAAAAAGEAVSTDELIEELWAGKPPATAKDALQNYVSQLRKALGPEVIVTRDPGYVLEATPAQTDLGRFERLVAEARGESVNARAAKLREALGCGAGRRSPTSPTSPSPGSRWRGSSCARRPRQISSTPSSSWAATASSSPSWRRRSPSVPSTSARVPSSCSLSTAPGGRRTRSRPTPGSAHARRGAGARAGDAAARARAGDPAPGHRALEAPLAAPVGLEERRKTVTILFADLVESTELAEALDPESLRRVLDGYFGAARRAIEGHGGTIEKFIGDAVMAVFGVPVAHEDDALRPSVQPPDTRAAVAALARRSSASMVSSSTCASGSTRATSTSATPATGASSRAMRSTSPSGSSKRRRPARSCSAPRRSSSSATPSA